MTTAAVDRPVSTQTWGEEAANVATHGLGLIFAVIGVVVGCLVAEAAGGVTRVVTVVVFTGALVLTYLASTGFHLAARRASRQRWRLLDHASIYVLIAGTYTPVLLVAVGGAWGWSLFGVAWAMAAAGVLMKIVLVGRYDKFERLDTLLYLAMGWLCLAGAVPIWNGLSAAALGWLFAGGMFYSVGCVFFLWDRLPYNHAIWHGFVLAGSACHYLSIVGHVVPIPE